MVVMNELQPSRGELAMALVAAVEATPELAVALTLHEAWHPGYTAEILRAAEGQVLFLGVDLDRSNTELAAEAVSRALAELHPRHVLDVAALRPHADAVEGLVTLVRSYAAFQTAADTLERRRQSRLALAS